MKKYFYLCCLLLLAGRGALVAQEVSSEIVARSVSELIDMKYTRQMDEELQSIKKDKDREKQQSEMKKIQTSQAKLYRLNAASLKDVNGFVLSSISNAKPVGETEDVVSFYMPGMGETRKEWVYYLFLDEHCIGVGSAYKGIRCVYPADAFEKTLHTLKIIAVLQNDKQTKTDALSASIHLGIKKHYLLSGLMSLDIIN